MKPQIPWLRVFVEGVAIVVSILLAFGIDAWWDARQERDVEAQYIVRLHAELVGRRSALVNQVDRQRRTAAAMDTLLVLGDADELDGRPDLAMTILNGGSYEFGASTVVTDQTYDEMLATGTLRFIRDPNVREVITGYYQLAERVATAVSEATAAGYRQWGNRVRAAMGTLPREWFTTEPSLNQATSFAKEPSPAQAQRLVALLQSDGWSEEVRYAKTRVEDLEFFLSELVDATDSLIGKLADHPALPQPLPSEPQ